MILRFLCAFALVLGLASSGSLARAATSVRVVIPDSGNLQYMSFWVAKGAGFFDDEKIAIVLSIPDAPGMTKELFRKGEAQVAVLPPPMYLELIADNVPIVLVANLFQNDPINLVVRRSVMDERKLSAAMPLGERLRGLAGLRVGVAPNPPTRLRALFASQGLDADKDIAMVIVHGKDQNAWWADGKLDALYAHTPYLEKALVDQDAVMLVNQSAGEVPELATRQIHALVFTRAFLTSSRDVALAMTRAIYRAEKLVHTDRAASADAILREFPELDRRRVDTIVALYAPAVPDTPRVSADGFAAAMKLFPAGHAPPDISGIDLASHVAPDVADEVVSGSGAKASKAPWKWIGAIAATLAAIAAALAMRNRKHRAKAR